MLYILKIEYWRFILEHLPSLDDIRRVIADESFVLLYLSRPGCGVCQALLPRIGDLAASVPGLTSFHIDLDEVPEAAGQLSVFTIPGILVFADGRESIREARYLSLDDLAARIRRLRDLLFDP